MSIYRLVSDVWQSILYYLDATDAIKLLSTGDSALRSRLKHAIRDFCFCLQTRTSPRLSSLLCALKDYSRHPLGFSVSLGPYHYKLKFLPETHTAEKWKTFFPETLEVLQLDLECEKPPFTSFFASLAHIAPNLTALRVRQLASELTLPRFLKKLELGTSSIYSGRNSPLNISSLIQRLPTTLTHLQLPGNQRLVTKIAAPNLPFKNMPLVFFQGNICFQSLSKEEALWSLLPNSIVNLTARLSYGEKDEFFEFPRNPTWTQIFPGLTSIDVPMDSLVDDSMFKKLHTSFDEEIPAKQIETISFSFPTSLTSLQTALLSGSSSKNDLLPTIRALGHRLRFFNCRAALFDRDIVKFLPRWENPKFKLLDSIFDYELQADVLAEGEDFEKFQNDKEHPIFYLNRSATSLNPSILTLSAIPFLPKTLTSMDFNILGATNSFSLESAMEVAKQLHVRNNIGVNGAANFDFNPQLVWTHLEWPTALTTLYLRIYQPEILLHLGCLPATLTKLNIQTMSEFELQEGGNLAHIRELTHLQLSGTPRNSGLWFTSLNSLPRSLRSLSLLSAPCAEHVFVNEEFQKFFFNLEELCLDGIFHDANVLLWIPPTLSFLTIMLRGEGGSCWSEKHFENISRTKLASLQLSGPVKWPEELSFDVFSRYLPKTLASLCLYLPDWNGKNFEEEIARHIPDRLLSFESANFNLKTLVDARMAKHKK